ncbi:DUF721 domain-containing protein, partial [Salinispora arenicola]|nr:DUF721 domain-containing protein [Salinispora arenicola]
MPDDAVSAADPRRHLGPGADGGAVTAAGEAGLPAGASGPQLARAVL